MNEINQQYIESREVAEMIGKNHADLLRDIRRYCVQLAESKIALGDFFKEDSYKDINNQSRLCYLVTIKGCEFIAHKLTGTKGADFTARYINRFHEMKSEIANKHSGLSPQLQLLQGMLDTMAEQERRLNRVEGFVDTVKTIYTEPIADWRSEINSRVCQMAKKSGEHYQVMYTRLYEELERRAKCDLSRLVENKARRLADAGKSKSFIESVTTKIAIIEDNARLKAIFDGIIKDFYVRYCA